MIRTAKIDDIESVTKLANSLWHHDSFAELKEELCEILSKDDAVIALYCQDTKPIAFAQCQLRQDYVESATSSPVAYLEGIFVDENFRRQGIAR